MFHCILFDELFPKREMCKCNSSVVQLLLYVQLICCRIYLLYSCIALFSSAFSCFHFQCFLLLSFPMPNSCPLVGNSNFDHTKNLCTLNPDRPHRLLLKLISPLHSQHFLPAAPHNEFFFVNKNIISSGNWTNILRALYSIGVRKQLPQWIS